MLYIAICDDLKDELNKANKMLCNYLKQRKDIDLAIRKFQSATELMIALESGKRFDIYILDILMPDINGIVVGKKIRELDDLAAIIYLTSSPDYAVRAYGVQAYYYLMKPLQEADLFPILDRLIHKITNDMNNFILVNTHGMKRVIQLCDIQYAENLARIHAIRYFLADGSHIESGTLRKPFDQAAAPLLADPRFMQIGSSFAVNMRYIKAFGKGTLVMQNGYELSIPQRRRTEVKKQYIDFILERADMRYDEES